MNCDLFANEEVAFPVEVHFRIVAMATADVTSRIVEAASELGLAEKLQSGNASASGKYQSHQISLVVESHDQMQHIDQTFRSLEGVKMVL
jgi:putative lipoic acid-binding regulatory protein